jgi:hypothetical protein
MRFIEVTDKTGEKMLINPAQVEAAYPGNREGDQTTTLQMVSGVDLEVAHPYEDVKVMIEQAQA